MLCSRNSVSALVVLAAITPLLIKISSKNSCLSYFEYLFINVEGHCFHNSDVDLSVPQIIEKYTGNVKTYNVTTEDGYVLTMFRIPRKDPVGVILLQPPISAGSIAYLSDSGYSIGIALWEKGYDVWLSNHRGASYSRKHVNYSDTDREFWSFGFHEVAIFDLEAQFTLITKETNSKITYVGYSMASTVALIYASLKPDQADQFIDSFVLAAPLTVMKHLTAPYTYIFHSVRFFQNFFRENEREFPTADPIRLFGRTFTIAPYIVNILTSIIMGWTPSEMDPVLYPYIFAHHGRGVSNKMIIHFGQIWENGGDFVMYDYGEEINKVKYGSAEPPPYPLKAIKNSMYIIYGDKDSVTTPLDIKILYEELLPREAVAGVFPIENHNHVDFFFSRHRREKTLQTVLSILDQIKVEKEKKNH